MIEESWKNDASGIFIYYFLFIYEFIYLFIFGQSVRCCTKVKHIAFDSLVLRFKNI